MSTPATPVVAAKVGFWSKVWHDVTVAEHAVVSFITGAAAKVPEAEALIAQYGPEAAALLNSISAGAGKYAVTASNAAATIGSLIEDGGTAVESKLLNVGFDQTLISDIKSLWANLKASTPQAAPPAAAPAPAAPAAK
jgi:hypothetical protein